MTTTSRQYPDRAAAPMLGRVVHVRWTASVASRPDLAGNGNGLITRVVFNLTLRVVSGHHALLDAWVETPDGVKALFERQPVACAWLVVDRLMHVDAHLDGRRLLALSLRVPQHANRDGDVLLYAQSALLADAGFAAGSYDPPTARILAAEHDAASA
jgi:hypothetical protein